MSAETLRGLAFTGVGIALGLLADLLCTLYPGLAG
jgi:hypothetical protein